MEKSELSAACQELEQKAAALEDALRAAEEANQAKSRFLSNMSHDIRTPVNAIVGLTTIGLSHIDEKARVQDCLRKIQTASAHLMSLVNDVLDMSRIDSGRMVLSQEEFSLADLIHDIAVIVRPQAVQKGQDLRLDIRGIDQERLVGDPLRLRQILVNIINNAVKYTQEAGRITVSFRQDPVRTSPQGERTALLRFACQDNGMGMSPEFLERIFLPFERVHTSQVSRIEGTGRSPWRAGRARAAVSGWSCPCPSPPRGVRPWRSPPDRPSWWRRFWMTWPDRHRTASGRRGWSRCASPPVWRLSPGSPRPRWRTGCPAPCCWARI